MDPLLPVGYLISGLITAGLPIVGIYYFWKKKATKTKILGLAALGFIGAQIVSEIISYILNPFVSSWLIISSSILSIAIVLGVFIAVGSESVRFLILKRFKEVKEGPVAFGLTWGALQPILLGTLSLLIASQMFALVSTTVDDYVGMFNESGFYSATELEQIRSQADLLYSTPWYLPVLTSLESIFLIFFQVSFTLIMLEYFKSKQLQYLVFVFLMHSISMTANLYLQLYNTYLALGVYATLSILTFFSYLKISGMDLKKFQRKYL
jgi:uncharacterized membrane protein YhfC